jgi:hypothetical protein
VVGDRADTRAARPVDHDIGQDDYESGRNMASGHAVRHLAGLVSVHRADSALIPLQRLYGSKDICGIYLYGHSMPNSSATSGNFTMKTSSSTAVAAALAAGLFTLPTPGAAASGGADEVYTAQLQPMNVAASHHRTTGDARFEINGDRLTITIHVKDAAPGITHWQHFHGLLTDQAASCATAAADINGDGVVDLIETEPASGTTMVPFDDMPSAMDVAHGVYPRASSKGDYTYHKVVSLKALSAAFAKAFNGQPLNLDKRVLLIHGVPADTKLPATVKSLGPIPAHVTLPIACGKIERVAQ